MRSWDKSFNNTKIKHDSHFQAYKAVLTNIPSFRLGRWSYLTFKFLIIKRLDLFIICEKHLFRRKRYSKRCVLRDVQTSKAIVDATLGTKQHRWRVKANGNASIIFPFINRELLCYKPIIPSLQIIYAWRRDQFNFLIVSHVSRLERK